MTEKVLVIYDGDCRFCRFGIDIVRRVDLLGALDFCPFGHPVAERELAPLPEETRYDSFHAVVGEILHSATEAAREVLRALPFGELLVAAGLHHTYPLLARYRGELGRYVPERPAVVTVGEPADASV